MCIGKYGDRIFNFTQLKTIMEIYDFAEFTQRIAQAKKDGRFILTDRLVLLPLAVSDAPEAFKWCGDAEVNEFMIYSLYDNVDDVAKWIAESGHNCFGIFLRESGQLIGCGDVHLGSSGDHSLGYNLAKAYWGKGYCTEASKGLLARCVSQGITDFVSEHAVGNARSGRVIQKCGFGRVGEGSYTRMDGKSFSSYKYALHVNSHEMDVDGKWLDKIANGTKTVELRLYDEKRRKINIGDYIVLINKDVADIKKCVVKVAAMHKFGSFTQLYTQLDMTKCGYGKGDAPNPDDMLAYYSAERQKECGVVGIEFELLCAM